MGDAVTYRPCPNCGSTPLVFGIWGVMCKNCEWQPYQEDTDA